MWPHACRLEPNRNRPTRDLLISMFCIMSHLLLVCNRHRTHSTHTHLCISSTRASLAVIDVEHGVPRRIGKKMNMGHAAHHHTLDMDKGSGCTCRVHWTTSLGCDSNKICGNGDSLSHAKEAGEAVVAITWPMCCCMRT